MAARRLPAEDEEEAMQRVANRIGVSWLAALLTLCAGRGAEAQKSAPIQLSAAGSVSRKHSAAPVVTSGAVWVPGFWDLRNDPMTAPHGGYVWVPGSWLTPPVPDARWDPGHWGWDGGWYAWVPAHWVVPSRHGYPTDLQPDQSTEVEMSAP